MPSWGFNLMILGAAVLLFGGIAVILGILYWFSLRGSRERESTERTPLREPTVRPSSSSMAGSRPGGFGSQGIPRSQSRNWQGIPQSERGASFFSGRPARVGEMHTTTVSIGGRRRRVLVDDDDWAILQAGQMPPMLMFWDMGNYVPWYAYSSYDPYMDYQGEIPDAGYYPPEQAAPQYWEEELPQADYAYTPDQEQYQDYAAEQALGAPPGQPSVAFEDVYTPSAPDDNFVAGEAPAWAGEAIDPLGDPADDFVDPLGDPADSMSDSGIDPLGDPADSLDAS